MANSIVKEVTFTPNSFEKNFALENERKFEKLLDALHDIATSGIIIGISNQWQEEVNEAINHYDDRYKDEIQEIFEYLGSRNRIVFYPISKELGNSEDNWIKQANVINKLRALDVIVASKDSAITKQIDHIDRGFFKNKGAKVNKQTKEFMNDMLSPILSYAEIVTIIDPYFSFKHNRFNDALEIICKNLANHHGIKENAVIDIQTSIKSMLDNKEFKWQLANEWPKIIKKFEKDYGHTITLKIWEENQKDKWHERWIITNQCGIFIGKGSDISEWTDSTWSLLDWNELADITNKFDTNRKIYNYIGSVTSKGVSKNQNPKDTITYMTEEEKKNQELNYDKKTQENNNARLEKLANVKVFGKNKR